jgi:hypothetical protein
MMRVYAIWLYDKKHDDVIATWENLSDVDVMGVIGSINIYSSDLMIEIKIRHESND